MAVTNYSADKVAYNAAINEDITTQTGPNTIPPEVVGSGYTDLANMLEPYILRINNAALLDGTAAPTSGLGQDLDLYFQQTNPIIIWRKIAGVWQQQVELPFGVILPEGNMTVRTLIEGLSVTASKGGWSISNVIYQKATETAITVTSADLNFTRIDNIYGTTSNTIIYQEGTPSSTPVAPTLPANTVLIDNVIVPASSSGDAPYLLYGGSILPTDSTVQGPNTSTDNAIARFNGLTGAVIKDSNVLINDAGDIIAQGTGAIKLHVGTTAERPATPLDGHFRRNITLGELEYYDADSGLWKQLSAITPGTYIENQNLLAQTANIWITGTIKANGGMFVGSNAVWHAGNLIPLSSSGQNSVTDWNSLTTNEGLLHGSGSATNSPTDGFFTAFKLNTDTNPSFYNLIGSDFSGNWFIRNGTSAWNAILTSITGVTLDTAQTITGAKTFESPLTVKNIAADNSIVLNPSTAIALLQTVNVAGDPNNLSINALGGNVGIGLALGTAPTEKLHVAGSMLLSGNDAGVIFDNPASFSTGLTFKTSGVNKWSINKGAGDGTDNWNFYNFGRTFIDFTLNDSTGNIGIGVGTVTPTEKLHVAGGILSTRVTQSYHVMSTNNIDWSLAGYFAYAITGDVTLTMSAYNVGQSIQIIVSNNSGNTRTIAITGVTWVGSPALAIPNTKVAVISLSSTSIIVGTFVVEG